MSAAFRAAVEAGDFDAATDLLHDDVVFRSPAVFKAYQGKATVTTILKTVGTVFEDFRYIDDLVSETGTHVLVFEARVGEKTLQGMDYLKTDAEGRITELTVMIRPLSGLIAVAEQMGPKLAAAGV
jgi:ketosteroid isomerase-like protein